MSNVIDAGIPFVDASEERGVADVAGSVSSESFAGGNADRAIPRAAKAITKVGIVGCGYWGPKLARNFHDLKGARLSSICDFREDRLRHMKELYPDATTTRDYQELLDSDVDAIVIATPVSKHHPLAMRALRAGKHVLVEKPLAASSLEAVEIARTADELGLAAMVGHTFLFNPAVVAVRRILEEGRLGEVYYLNGMRLNLGLLQPDINVIWDLAPHDLSILLYLLGAEPLRVSAQGDAFIRRGTSLHELAFLRLVFPNNIHASLQVSWLDPVKVRRFTIVGSKGMLVYDDIADNKVVLMDKGVEVPPYSDTLEQFQMSYRHGPETPVAVEWSEPLKIECQAFIDWIQTGTRAPSDAWLGAKVVRILETAQRSLRNGGVPLEVEL